MFQRILFVITLLPVVGLSQLVVVSTQPQNTAINVPLTTRVSITFNETLDTLALQNADYFLSNIPGLQDGKTGGWTDGGKTGYADVTLEPNTVYFFCIYYAKAQNGIKMVTPFVYHFTTGPSFPPYSISGTLTGGSTGLTPENSIITVSSRSIEQGEPDFIGWGTVQSNGTFSIPYLANGTYWPLAAKDVNQDGLINPEDGIDALAFGDSIVVNNGNVTSISLELIQMKPLTLAEALPKMDSLRKDLSAEYLLRQISAWRLDTAGYCSDWNFSFTKSDSEGIDIRVSNFDSRIGKIDELQHVSWLHRNKEITNPAQIAPSPTVLHNVELNGGQSFRSQPMGDKKFVIEARIGTLAWSEYWFLTQDTAKLFWGVKYRFGYEGENDWYDVTEKYFLLDIQTGSYLNAGTSVQRKESVIPEQFSLSQNYPNPFNPTTSMEITLPRRSEVSLKVYDMLGREIAVIIQSTMDAGSFSVQWNADQLPSGMYVAMFKADGYLATRKMMLLK